LFVLQGIYEGIIGPKMLTLSGALLAFPLLWLVRRWFPYRVLLGAVITILTLVAALSMVLGGLTPGGSLILLMIIFLGGLFWGPKGTLVALLGCTLLVGLCAVFVLSGTIAPVSRQFWNPSSPIVWVRYLVVFSVTAGSLAFALSSMIRKLEQSVSDLGNALMRERSERAHREKIEGALERSKQLEAMGQLAGGIAHDFNNSLTVVLGMIDLIEHSKNPEGVRSAIEAIRETALSSAATARQMLLLGRKDQSPKERISLREPFKVLETAIRHAASGKVAVQVDTETATEVFASGSRLQHALLNVALNAADAVADEGRITVVAENCAIEQEVPGWNVAPGAFVRVSVSDTGSGMTEATLQRIFEPFFTTKAPGKGTGLGLAMVRSTVYDAGGFINVDSALTKGTTFHLYFPAAPR
jgi:signal transduction histidine kinase